MLIIPQLEKVKELGIWGKPPLRGIIWENEDLEQKKQIYFPTHHSGSRGSTAS